MRFRYSFDVQSHTRSDVGLRFTYDGYDFRLDQENGRLTKIIVTTPHVEVLLDWFTIRDRTNYIDPPDPFFEKVQGWLRVIRGTLGLIGVANIILDECLREFLPSTMDENVKIRTKSIRYQRFKRDELPLGDHLPEQVVQCVLSYETIGEYEIPLEFQRRGRDDLHHERYVEAIFNFFFVLEYLFGDGQYQTAQLIDNFQASPQLIEGLAEARRQTSQHLLRAHTDARKRYRENYGDATDEQVIRTIVIKLRGFLHHQSAKRPRTWHPTLQREYGVDAYFLGAVSQHVLMKLVTEILGTDEAKAKLTATPGYSFRRDSTQRVTNTLGARPSHALFQGEKCYQQIIRFDDESAGARWVTVVDSVSGESPDNLLRLNVCSSRRIVGYIFI
jgi:hypothetical protein